MTLPTYSWLAFGIAVLAAILFALLVTALAAYVTRLITRRAGRLSGLSRRMRRPFRLCLLAIVLWIAVYASSPVRGSSLRAIDHVLEIAVIASGAWLLGGFLIFLEDLGLARNRLDVPDNRVARRIRTQMLILRRLTIVVIVLIACAAILLSFPEVRVFGASVLASAGIVSVVAGLAAQSTLGNVFAGIQLAFNGAIRVDDVVIVEQTTWGRIEEITLTYVVVHVWDDTRMVLPSSYFTTQPFQNWTRHSSQLLGQIDFDLDWSVEPGRMREQLDEILHGTELWDGRASVLQVTDAVGGFVHVRILVTAVDSATLFDLRCHVREALVGWIQRESEHSMPRQRVTVASPTRTVPRADARTGDPQAPGLFSGSEDAERRADRFTAGHAETGDAEG